MTTKPLITDLSEEDRKAVEERLNLLSGQMRQCEVYLRDYMAGNQNAMKFLNTVGRVHEDIGEAAKELMRLHDLPNFISVNENTAR